MEQVWTKYGRDMENKKRAFRFLKREALRIFESVYKQLRHIILYFVRIHFNACISAGHDTLFQSNFTIYIGYVFDLISGLLKEGC
jgi:hypothetical protein